ncbi:uncharacterized protein ACNLHF_010709 isoform 2-T3 [Anomaloglossus baeobatrachus]|uniref:uncharacterized protein LOC142295094 n=1 Tax=Anomaloglossus baeobatrachus TaxID=238106 RepID=UPI003F4F5F93
MGEKTAITTPMGLLPSVPFRLGTSPLIPSVDVTVPYLLWTLSVPYLLWTSPLIPTVDVTVPYLPWTLSMPYLRRTSPAVSISSAVSVSCQLWTSQPCCTWPYKRLLLPVPGCRAFRPSQGSPVHGPVGPPPDVRRSSVSVTHCLQCSHITKVEYFTHPRTGKKFPIPGYLIYPPQLIPSFPAPPPSGTLSSMPQSRRSPILFSGTVTPLHTSTLCNCERTLPLFMHVSRPLGPAYSSCNH